MCEVDSDEMINGEENQEDQILESDSDMSGFTIMMPGYPPEESEEAQASPDDADHESGDDSTACQDENTPSVTKAGSSVDMRELYWKVVHEAQTKIRKAHPEMSGREVLAKAREAWFGCM